MGQTKLWHLLWDSLVLQLYGSVQSKIRLCVSINMVSLFIIIKILFVTRPHFGVLKLDITTILSQYLRFNKSILCGVICFEWPFNHKCFPNLLLKFSDWLRTVLSFKDSMSMRKICKWFRDLQREQTTYLDSLKVWSHWNLLSFILMTKLTKSRHSFPVENWLSSNCFDMRNSKAFQYPAILIEGDGLTCPIMKYWLVVSLFK